MISIYDHSVIFRTIIFNISYLLFFKITRMPTCLFFKARRHGLKVIVENLWNSAGFLLRFYPAVVVQEKSKPSLYVFPNYATSGWFVCNGSNSPNKQAASRISQQFRRHKFQILRTVRWVPRIST